MSRVKLEDARRSSVAMIRQRHGCKNNSSTNRSARKPEAVLEHLSGLLPELAEMAADAHADTLSALLLVAAREASLRRADHEPCESHVD